MPDISTYKSNFSAAVMRRKRRSRATDLRGLSTIGQGSIWSIGSTSLILQVSTTALNVRRHRKIILAAELVRPAERKLDLAALGELAVA